jgi:hypothetical protein
MIFIRKHIPYFNMKKINLVFGISLVFIVFLSGCLNMSPEALAMANPLVKQFMTQYPNAKITVNHFTAEQSTQILENISAECGNPYITAKEYYRISIDDPDSGLKAISWVDWNNRQIECAVKYGVSGNKTISKPGEETKECKSHAEAMCYGEHVYWFDSCGHKEEKKEYCKYGCENGFCKDKKDEGIGENCTSHTETECYEGHVYWFDSCGNKEEKKEYCDCGCVNGTCAINITVHTGTGMSIGPGRINLDFEPNREFKFCGIVKNELNENVKIDLYDDGDLKEFGTFDIEEVVSLGIFESRNFIYTLKLPETFDRPGRHVGYIWAAQHVEPKPGYAIARVKVGATIWVNVPYPEKYAEMELNIKNAFANGTVNFEINVVNFGEKNITNATAEISIMDNENKTISTLETGSKKIEVGKTEQLKADWLADVSPGLYRTRVKIFYDGYEITRWKDFYLGPL